MNRRRALAAVATATATLAGCSALGGRGPSTGSSPSGDWGSGDVDGSIALDPPSVADGSPAWPRPHYDARNTAFATATGPADPVDVDWTTVPDGGVPYTFAIADETVYVGRPDGLVSIDAAGGGTSGPATGAPGFLELVTGEDALFLRTADESGSVVAQRRARDTDSLEWEQPLPTDSDQLASTVLADGTLIAYRDEHAVAIDADSGEHRWTYAPDVPGVDGTPFRLSSYRWNYVAAANDRVSLVDRSGSVHAVELESGERDWRTAVDASAVKAGVVAGDESIFVVGESADDGDANATTAGDGADASATALYALDATTGDVRGSYALRGTDLDSQPLPALADGVLFVVDPQSTGSSARTFVHAVDAGTGERYWRREIADATSSVQPVVADGTVYCGLGPPDDAAVADGTSHDDLGPLDGATVVALDVATGDTQWEQSLTWESEDAPILQLAVADDTVYASGGGGVTAIR